MGQGTGGGSAEDSPVCENGVEDGIAVEMAVEMGARKRIKGGRAPPRGAFGRPGAVSRGLRDCIFGGIEKNGGEKGRNAWIDCGQYGNMRFFDGV